MGSMWVDDPSWGNIFGNFASEMDAAPGKALQARLIAEKVKSERISQQQELAKAGLAKSIGDTFSAQMPQATEPNTPVELTALPTVNESGQWSTPDAGEAFKIPDSWVDPRVNAQLQGRNKLVGDTARLAALSGKTNEIMPLYAQGQASAGYPQSQQQRDLLQFQTHGTFPDRSVDETKTPSANYTILNKDNQPTGRTVLSRDGKTTIDGEPIPLNPGEYIAKGSPIAAERPSPYGDKGRMQEEFAALSAKANRGEPLSPNETERAGVIREQLFPQAGAYQTMGGRQQYVTTRPVPVPDYGGRLSGLIDDYRNGVHLQPQAQQPPQLGAGIAPRAMPVPYSGITGSGAGSAALPAEPAAPAAPAPIVPQGIGANAPQLGVLGPSNPAEIRKEIQNTQQYDDYNKAVTVYNSAIQSAKSPSNQADLDIIYAIAKLFDPGSVVREGELKMAASTGTIGQQLMSRYSALATGKGMLEPEVRAGLLEAGRNRMQQYGSAKDMIANYYAQKVIPSQGLKPEEVLPPTLPMSEFSREEIMRAGAEAAATAANAPPATAIVNQADKLVGAR